MCLFLNRKVLVCPFLESLRIYLYLSQIIRHYYCDEKQKLNEDGRLEIKNLDLKLILLFIFE